MEYPEYPYLIIFGILLLCGVGLPLPEEIIAIGSGYLSAKYPELVHPWIGWGVIVGSILISDSIPFSLGKAFGPRLLRLRLMRSWMHQERLASFDSWFRNHGNKTILISRFLPGIRVPAFFTAGCMGVSYLRFLILNGLGALISSGAFIFLGNRFSNQIDQVVDWVQGTERGLLIILGVGGALFLAWWMWKSHRRRKLLGEDIRETFVEPTRRRHEVHILPSARRPFGPPPPPEIAARIQKRQDEADGAEEPGEEAPKRTDEAPRSGIASNPASTRATRAPSSKPQAQGGGGKQA